VDQCPGKKKRSREGNADNTALVGEEVKRKKKKEKIREEEEERGVGHYDWAVRVQ